MKFFALLPLLPFAIGSAHAATIIDFDFSGVDGSSSHTKSSFEITTTDTIDPNLTLVEGINVKNDSVLNFTVSGGAATNDLNLSNWGGGSPGNLTNAINGNRYFSFFIQAASGYQLNLNGATLSTTLRRNGSAAPQDYAFTAVVAPANDNDLSASDQIGSAGNYTNTSTHTYSVTFSGSQWDGITDEVEVRLYGYTATTGNTHFSDLVIDNGSVTLIPEPTSTLLLGLGGVLTLLRRKR
ncbi:MAG: PEP-CTERM sorting domain-containing protein [Akkermansiaceae bacterium]|nr:PEP-CTERM sorting domain-containing protein [Akkermansiaceae bacterium]